MEETDRDHLLAVAFLYKAELVEHTSCNQQFFSRQQQKSRMRDVLLGQKRNEMRKKFNKCTKIIKSNDKTCIYHIFFVTLHNNYNLVGMHYPYSANMMYFPLAMVSEVMGVPIVAVQSIARQNHLTITTVDSSACIDENALHGVYADAYVRKIKCYYNNCTRYYDELNNAEQLQFYQFCNQYKKASLPGSVCKWEDIDEESIRAHFEQEVKKKSPKRKKGLVIDLFSGLGGLELSLKNQDTVISIIPSEKEDNVITNPPYERKYAEPSNILHTIVHSRWACRKPKKRIRPQICAHSPVWLVPARYYVYSGDDNDHIENTVLQVNGHTGDQLYNSIPRMAS